VAGQLVVAMRDPVVLARLRLLAARHRLAIVDDPVEPTVPGAGESAGLADHPVAAVAELELPGAIDRISAWRRLWPGALLTGSIRIPDQELWHGALAAGADLVANRGAFVIQLERALVSRGGGPGEADGLLRLPVRLMDRAGDGLVGRLPDAPGGSIAVFRVGQRLCAIRDECPHAGASLADGAFDGTIITCPRHGSQFDVVTGSRERGPSDFPIRTYRTLIVDGVTCVEVPA
jgi:nitrite reductase/ring-hydroxylating ferredoxin subunit